jgi:ribose 5-phosphate isomerase B
MRRREIELSLIILLVTPPIDAGWLPGDVKEEFARGARRVRIAIGSDHAGFELKGIIIQRFSTSEREFTDFGANSPQSVDYPDIAAVVAEAVARGDCDRGILICGTGIGMAMAANKVPGIRAALCHDLFTAKASREHNDANILTLGERVLQPDAACAIVDAWLQARFAGGRHTRRVQKIMELEQKYCTKK